MQFNEWLLGIYNDINNYFEVFSKTWKKELFYTNLKVNTSGGAEDLFKANSSFFAVPWISGTFSILNEAQ